MTCISSPFPPDIQYAILRHLWTDSMVVPPWLREQINQKRREDLEALYPGILKGDPCAFHTLARNYDALQFFARLRVSSPYQARMLWMAVGHHDLHFTRDLIGRGADVNTENLYGETVLLMASKHGYTDMVRLLIDHGADVHHSNRLGKTALMVATRYGHVDIVRLLLNRGSDIHHTDQDGNTTFTIASDHLHTDLIQTLMDHYHNITPRTSHGEASKAR